ncbi:cupin domain-containing protein [Nocardia sienata]|uniref:cupin domain-containing protein n=1 Tax=Nocardia sienata TaxID=248552 RepID=UPI0007A48AD4|nr:cupin domain-containing protein [Nocardia sienata]
MPYPTPDTLVVPAATAEIVDLPHGGAFHLLADAVHTGGALGANRLVLGAGADGAAPHYHGRSTELFYVLTGIAEFFLDGTTTTAHAGSLVVVPPGMPHAFGAAPGSPVDLLIVLTPGVQRFEYFRQLGRIRSGHADFDSLLPEQQRYDVHFLPATTWRRPATQTRDAPA